MDAVEEEEGEIVKSLEIFKVWIIFECRAAYNGFWEKDFHEKKDFHENWADTRVQFVIQKVVICF